MRLVDRRLIGKDGSSMNDLISRAAAMYAACILAGRADDREERWFEKRNK